MEEVNKLNSQLRISSTFISNFTFDYDEQIKKNMAKATQEKTQIGNLKVNDDSINEPLEINRLFNSENTSVLDSSWEELPF